MKRILFSLMLISLIPAAFADVNTPKDSNSAGLKNEQKKEDQELCLAAQNGDIQKVKELIAKGCNVNIRDQYSWTPLHAALNSGQKEVAKFLIANGADVNAPNDHGVLPVMLAIIKNNNDIANMLIAKGAPKTIYVAAAMGDVESVKTWLKKDPNLANAAAANDGWSAMLWAAYLDRPDVIKALIESGANVNVHEKKLNAYTPLHWAVRMGNTNSAKILIANGSDVNFTTPGGGTLLHFAVNYDVARLLIDKDANVNAVASLELQGMTPLHALAHEGGLREIQRVLFIKSGQTRVTDFDKQRGEAEKMSAKIAELLITKGADINAKTGDGSTPLILAANYGNAELVKLLLQKGAVASIKTSDGKTAMALAKSKGHTNVVQLLEKGGAKE